MKTLFLGLGNPILGDDGVGIRVVEEIERIIGNNSEFEFLKPVPCTLFLSKN